MAQRRRQREFEASLRPVSARELCVGCILWLPEKVMGGESVKCILSECRCNNSELESDGYKHYVVVLDTFRINDEKIKCYVAKLTSQTGTRRYMIDRIEISQDSSASSSLDEPGKLYLEHGSMPKQSFVSLNHAFQISPKLLRTLKPGNPAYDRRLTEQSYTYLMEILGLRTALYEDTDRVRQSGATIPTGIPEIPTRKDRMEAPILHTGYPATASVIAPTAPMAILALPNSMAELGSWNSHQSRASSSAHNLSATQTSTPTPHDPDHEALSKAFMLSSQPKTSRAISPTSRAILNHPPTRSTNREPNTFEPSRENRAQRSATETDPLLHRSPKVQGLERKAVRAPDLESGAHHRRRNGPGLTC
ncbi:hypothetical protein DSL72_007403 [Monilinia vaccinii-corymbosi]|uniref:Uncharacterized protein n=1 Tax=Monilinia vaccinii-corymbosi TaxID=61207 RepID=A0A8A3PLI7_9HELO|nr:hypothetical protein DSL72_007403 [Monilinia vaccinii-corymbosi]